MLRLAYLVARTVGWTAVILAFLCWLEPSRWVTAETRRTWLPWAPARGCQLGQLVEISDAQQRGFEEGGRGAVALTKAAAVSIFEAPYDLWEGVRDPASIERRLAKRLNEILPRASKWQELRESGDIVMGSKVGLVRLVGPSEIAEHIWRVQVRSRSRREIDGYVYYADVRCHAKS